MQPWASLLAVGQKRIETRGWRTLYRGPLLIHASARFDRDSRDLCFGEPFRSALDPGRRLGGRDLLARCPTGAALAVAELHDCIPTASARAYVEAGPAPEHGGFPAHELAFGDYRPGRWAWLLRDVRALPVPIRVRGSLGLWAVPPGVLAAVREALGEIAAVGG